MQQYDPKQVAITVGPFLMSGFAKDSMVDVEANEDAWKLSVGTDGEGTRSKSNDNSGKITITLDQTSASNAVLSDFAAADRKTNNGTFPVMVKDGNGASLYSSPAAWVKKMPKVSLKNANGPREWVIETDNLIMYEGGN